VRHRKVQNLWEPEHEAALAESVAPDRSAQGHRKGDDPATRGHLARAVLARAHKMIQLVDQLGTSMRPDKTSRAPSSRSRLIDWDGQQPRNLAMA